MSKPKELYVAVKELRDHVFYLNNILENVKEWLDQEAEGQEVIDEYEGGLRPKCTDGTDDIIEGRVESANALLEQIKKWEEGEEDVEEVSGYE